jgi:hypothetical protein
MKLTLTRIIFSFNPAKTCRLPPRFLQDPDFKSSPIPEEFKENGSIAVHPPCPGHSLEDPGSAV